MKRRNMTRHYTGFIIMLPAILFLLFFFSPFGWARNTPLQLTSSQWVNGYYLYSWSPGDSRLAFVMERDGNADIWTLNRLGGDYRRLTTHPCKDILPSWSPDGKSIAYLSDRGGEWALWTMENDGSGARRLLPVIQITPLTTEPVWSTDGLSILTVSFRGGSWDLWKVDRDGRNALQLTHDDRSELAFSWCHKGTSILFASTDQGRSHICTVRIDGTDEKRLTGDTGVNILPDLSPDGKNIAYVSGKSMSSAIYRMSLSGENRILLSSTRCLNTLPRWSPDGNWISFLSNRGGNLDLWKMDDGGGHETQLTYGPGSPFGLRWMKSGSISYVSFRNNLFDIYVIDPETRSSSQVTRNLFPQYEPDWSFDERYLATTCQGGNGNRLLIFDCQDLSSRYVFPEAGSAQSYPAFNPRNNLLAFTGGDENESHIYVGNLEEGTAERITKGIGAHMLASWSPGGENLTFYSRASESWQLSLYRGCEKRVDTLCAVSDIEEESQPPCWSSDGREIILCREQGEDSILESVDITTGKTKVLVKSGCALTNPLCSSGYLYFMKILEDREEIIRYDTKDNSSMRIANMRRSESKSRFSIHNQKLVFAYGGDLFEVERPGSQEKRMVSLEGEETCPKISPRGNRLVFLSVRGNNRDLFLTRLDQ